MLVQMTDFAAFAEFGLKGQQIIAQGIALGNMEAINTPWKGKRTIAGHRPAITLLPFQGGNCASVNTQGVALGYYLLPFQGVHTQNFTKLFFKLLLKPL